MTKKQEELMTVIAYRMPSLTQMYCERLDELKQRYAEAVQEKGEDDLSVRFLQIKIMYLEPVVEGAEALTEHRVKNSIKLYKLLNETWELINGLDHIPTGKERMRLQTHMRRMMRVLERNRKQIEKLIKQ